MHMTKSVLVLTPSCSTKNLGRRPSVIKKKIQNIYVSIISWTKISILIDLVTLSFLNMTFWFIFYLYVHFENLRYFFTPILLVIHFKQVFTFLLLTVFQSMRSFWKVLLAFCSIRQLCFNMASLHKIILLRDRCWRLSIDRKSWLVI